MATRLQRWPATLLLLTAVALGLGSSDLVYAHAAHLSRGNGCSRVVALTFDDGPNPPYTQQIIDVLKRNHARATFFVEGKAAAEHPGGVRLLRDAGMAIGSHSYAHSEDLRMMQATDFRDDLERAEMVLESIVGRKPVLYRAPFGETSATMLQELRSAGYTSIGWDVDSTDWRETAPEKIVAQVSSEAHPGAIVLLHDGGLNEGNPDRTGTVEALPAIIAGLRERGYELVTVPDILDPKVCSASLR
jgi:peptidoglycan/xylan/chitin deacetylase (PgdA/CDA1 family)